MLREIISSPVAWLCIVTSLLVIADMIYGYRKSKQFMNARHACVRTEDLNSFESRITELEIKSQPKQRGRRKK